MKKFHYVDENENFCLYVGTAEDIKGLYRSLYKKSCDFYPTFLTFPKFNYERFYGLLLDLDAMTYEICSSDTALRLIIGYNL
jgi:hypothetical protein